MSPALSSPPIAVFLAREHLAGRNHSNASSLEFDVVSLSDSMGWEVPLVKRALRQLQWDPRLRQGTGIPGFLVGGGEKIPPALPAAGWVSVGAGSRQAPVQPALGAFRRSQ